MVREQVLYTIIKIDTSFILENNLDIKGLTLKKAAQMNALVSVGDNILLDRIRAHKGDNRSYKEIFKDISFLRASLKKAKKEGRQKEARIFNQALLNTVYVKDIVNVEAKSKSDFRKVAKAGFYLNGVRYVAFTAGAGQLRRNTVTFISEDLYQPMFDLLSCGIDKKVKAINVPKFSAYFALTNSSIMWVDTPRCCVIKDFETTIPNQKVDWICKKENGEGYVEERLMDVVLNSCDGQGLIDPKWAQHWADNMSLDYCPSQFVIRSAYLKGNLAVFDFKEYAKREGIEYIYDCYGRQYKVEDIDVLLSQSQFKMWKYYSSWQEYLSYVDKGGIKWGVARYNKKEDPAWSQINYQFIQLLNINNEEIKELIQPTVDWIKNICSGDPLYALLYCFGGFNGDVEIEYNDVYSRAQNLATKLVVKNQDFLKDSYVQRKIYRNIIEAINRAKLGKIWARGNYQFAISDPIAQCRSALGLEVKGEIPADYIYSNFWNKLGQPDKVMVGRNPCIDQHELNPCGVYKSEEADYWYQYQKSGIIFSIYDTSVCRLEDSDFDGDIVCTLDNPLFIKGSHKDKTNIIMYDKQSAPVGKINHRNIIEGYIKGFGSKVGVYSNHATIIEAMLALFTKPEQEEQRKILKTRKKLLREVVGGEIDSAKGLAKPKEPWEFTHFENINQDDDDITKAEKYKHNSLVISKKPYFFRYLYPELNKQYKKHESQYNEISKCAFGIKFKKLLIKKDKTEQEKNLIRKYQKFCPLINSNCTMNILCREFENIDFDIKYNDSNITMLPDYQNLYIVKPEILKQYRDMYRKYSNKKAINYVTSLFDSEGENFSEIKFGIIDATREEIRDQWAELEMDVKKSLTYIHALAREYTKFNWAFAYDLLGELILDCVDQNKTYAPVEDENGKEYLGHKYILKPISKNIDFDIFDNDDLFTVDLGDFNEDENFNI